MKWSSPSTIADITSPLRRTKKREPSTVGQTNLTGVGPPIVQIQQKPVAHGDSCHPHLRRDSLAASVVDLTSQIAMGLRRSVDGLRCKCELPAAHIASPAASVADRR